MAKPDKGKKHTCGSCGAVFYDLNRTPILCPQCGEKVEVQALLKPRRPSPQSRTPKPVVEKPKPVESEAKSTDDAEADAEDIEGVDDEDDDDLIEDMSDIGNDDDDMSEVKVECNANGEEHDKMEYCGCQHRTG